VTATSGSYPLSLHDALPILKLAILGGGGVRIPLFVRGVLSRPGTSFREIWLFEPDQARRETIGRLAVEVAAALGHRDVVRVTPEDRKSTRLNSSHVKISYAV